MLRGPCLAGALTLTGRPTTPLCARAPTAQRRKPAAALRASRRGGLAVRAQKPSPETAEEEGGYAGQDFPSLASTVASRLASHLARQEGALDKLQAWLQEQAGAVGESAGKAAGGAAAARAGEGGQGDSAKGLGAEAGGAGEGVLSRLGRKAAQFLGVKSPGMGEEGEKSVPQLAAEALGVTSTDAVDSLKCWLSSPGTPEGGYPTKVVGALVYQLLQSFEKHTGEPFDGRAHHWSGLYTLSQEVLGSAMSRDLTKSLVKAYLRSGGRPGGGDDH